MYTIKQAALRSGLTIPTIRAWERRYGVVSPARTAGGYRLYDDAAIDRLVAMRHLVEAEGFRPSQAAAQVRAGGAAIDELARGTGQAGPWTPGGRDAVSAVREATRRMDMGAIERVLDEAFAAERFEAATTNVVYPALRAIGDDWAAGTIDVAMEHAASETIRRRLSRFYDAAVDLPSPPDVVIGLPPGCQHEIGAMGFAVAARRRGLSVLYLGADVPVASWVRTAEVMAAPVAVIGAIRDADAAAAIGVIKALQAAARPSAVVVGGRAAPRVASATGVVELPDQVDAAVDIVIRLVR